MSTPTGSSLATSPDNRGGFLDPTASYFEILGVKTVASDTELAAQFRTLSRRFHPDRFTAATAEIQDDALTSTALVNDAYRTLKDPFTRAEYLLRRERSVKLGELRDSKPPKALFATVMELQEALMEFQDGDESQRTHLEAAHVEFTEAYAALKARLSQLFTAYDSGETETALDGMQEVAATRGYIRRVLDNLNRALD
ncbi:Fe-S protein assembly co-chaperone HscB [Armatimonas sp.]|uniref:Fe-S protein assembly co-chaperone HscB n=1 Tax=Armatimonas sp. TaxID=1872638 RepID=UPI00374D50CE